MVMQRTRPVMAYNMGAVQMSQPAPAASLSANGAFSGGLSSGGGAVGTVMAIALIGLVVLYVATHGIQGSV